MRHLSLWTIAAAMMAGTCGSALAAAPDQIDLVVDLVTGEVRLVGNDGDPGEITSYEIGSPSGSLNLAGWISLADQSIPGWGELPSTAVLIGEDGGFSPTSVNATGFSLGTLFVVGGVQDLYFNYGDENFETIAGVVTYVQVPEPGALSLMAAGGLALLVRRRMA